MNKTNQTEGTRKAKVKGTDRIVTVYKLKNATGDKVWNIYLGDEISLPKITNKEHMETFSNSELEFID